ncbi:hypothetical protein POV27_04385 [Aureisphaera galaxeae]|uniref:hypothetical protein n=1 Tax=Aureisphaera galaxeae TaxID=1538023 RepID=UPI00235039E2|nr:hypothetical protein [Aureisphaera galaxeae]MDC8003274.1 hypothetical protein [Aureisphaera galaxeae]
MKKNYFFSTMLLGLFLVALTSTSFAQVGINTDMPQGSLDINSSNMGVVLPTVALTSSVVQAPVTNPQTGSIPVGTTVYNTATTMTGTNDVVPGIYSWDGSKWIPQFPKKQYQIFKSSTGFRPADGTSMTIIGTTAFTADFTGKYRINLRVDFGAGGAKVPNQGVTSQGNLNIARVEGDFTFTFDGTAYTIPVGAYSTAYDSSVGATNYFAIWEETNRTFYTNMDAGDSVNFSLTFLHGAGYAMNNDALFGTGLGYVAYDIPCHVEITYLGE